MRRRLRLLVRWRRHPMVWIEACRELGDYYADIAEKLHLHFVNASVWPVELGADGVHMTAKGHQIFAKELKKVLADFSKYNVPAVRWAAGV